MVVDDVESNQTDGAVYARSDNDTRAISSAEARRIEEAYGDDPEWDARHQAKADAYWASPDGIAFAELARNKYIHHGNDGHETIA